MNNPTTVCFTWMHSSDNYYYFRASTKC